MCNVLVIIKKIVYQLESNLAWSLLILLKEILDKVILVTESINVIFINIQLLIF